MDDERKAPGVHWQDPDEWLYNQPACGVLRIAPTSCDTDGVTCPVCLGLATGATA